MEKDHKRAQFDEKDLKILNISINDPSITDSEIAQKVQLSREAVVRRKKREGYQFLLRDSIQSTKTKLEEIATKAVVELDSLIDDPDPKVRIAAISLALKYLPEAKSVPTKESIKELVNQPEFIDEALKVPGVGHAIFMKMIKLANRNRE